MGLLFDSVLQLNVIWNIIKFVLEMSVIPGSVSVLPCQAAEVWW